MDSCEIVIVGGGPAGSSCAWKLKDSGLDLLVLDKQKFPREKTCGGWIAPAAFELLEIDPSEYAKGRILQPFFGFQVGLMNGTMQEIHYDKPVGYGIRRVEFDQFLVEHSDVWLQDGEALESLERSGEGWIINKGVKSRLVIGAGGHQCPVARMLGADSEAERCVTAHEVEVKMSDVQENKCSVLGAIPEIYFCEDLKGYGWCFRKENVLNIGMGHLDAEHLPEHSAMFIEFLRKKGRIPEGIPDMPKTHPFLLYSQSQRKIVDDGVMLIGDAAGLACSTSGEGIFPAIKSGLLAAETVLNAKGSYKRENFESYRSSLRSGFGDPRATWTNAISRLLPQSVRLSIARRLLLYGWFSRSILLNRWFLR